MKLMMHQAKRYRVFNLEDNEPYLIVRARDPFCLRALGAILDELHQAGEDREPLLNMAQCVVDWQRDHRDLIKWDGSFQDFGLIKRGSNG